MGTALYSGVSGLKNHQTRMDVIGNNISNVNTTGFKAGRANFQDMLSQTLKGAASPGANVGGTNPMQVGLGMSVASIDTLFTDGSVQATGVASDLSISGDGFFIVSDGSKQYYTRAGNFTFDPTGSYVTPSGLRVMGYMADDDGNLNSKPVPIVKPSGKTIPQSQSTATTLTGNLNAAAKNGEGATSQVDLYDSLGTQHQLTQSYYKVNQDATNNGANEWYCKSEVANATAHGAATPAVTYSKMLFDQTGQLVSTQDVSVTIPGAATQYVNMTNLKLSTSTDAQQLAFVQFDSMGEMHTFQMNFVYTPPTGGGIGTWNATVKDTTTQQTIGTIPVTYALAAGVPTYTLGTASLTYDSQAGTNAETLNFAVPTGLAPDGTKATGYFDFTDPAGLVPSNFTVAATDSPITCDVAGAGTMTIRVDRTKITQASDSGSSLKAEQDGYAMGTLSSYSFDSSGVMTGVFSNGQRRVLAQVILANFTNPGGLNKVSDTLYEKSNNSGEPSVGIAGIGGRGKISPSSLEMSNVDLAQQFSDMIITQRGYQANSKIITTTDSMMEEVVNLKR